MRAESQCEGKRGHCFPEGRLAERAINYRRQADRQTYRQGSQADRQADGTAESADRPDRTGAGPTHTKGRRRSATPLERTNERKKERKKKIHTHTTTTVPSPKRVRSASRTDCELIHRRLKKKKLKKISSTLKCGGKIEAIYDEGINN